MNTRVRLGNVLLLLCIPASVVVIFLLGSTMGNGSQQDAQLWTEQLHGLKDPETAQKADASIQVKRFKDGTWVFWKASDSHGSTSGGTIATRDSSGTLHAYMGHVCGKGFVDRVIAHRETSSSLDLHKALLHAGISEVSVK